MSPALDVKIMGILNVTPDSFSDGGRFHDKEAAVNQTARLINDGADIIDIGGESTRPYAEPVSLDEELSRVIPVIEAVRSFSDIPISIDTTKPAVARRAIQAGADIVNDISALRYDAEMLDVIRENAAADLIIMHMQGTPGTMQDDPVYGDVVQEILDFFKERLQFIESAGIDPARVIIDPGIGFGKKLEHNLSILKHLSRFSSLGCRVLLGHSRKRFLGELTGEDTDGRDMATALVAGLCHADNVSIFRVHNVALTRQALKVSQALHQA